MTKYFRNIVYISVFIGFLTSPWNAFAGSFDAFFRAIGVDNTSTIDDLLSRGFDPNTRNEKGQPGLVIAFRENCLKAAATLLARPDLDVDALNPAGESALMIAAINDELSGVQMLLARGAKINQPGWSPLHYAASGQDERILTLLLDRGAEIEATSPNGSTPLMMASQYGSVGNVKLLLQHGADPTRRNQLGLTAVDFARLSARVPLVELLENAQQSRH